MSDTPSTEHPTDPAAMLAAAIQMQRCHAFNVGYVLIPTPDQEVEADGDLDLLFATLDAEFHALTEHIIEGCRTGRIR
jgi:hypothetical protein